MEECCKKKHRDQEEVQLLLNRLKRIEGQIRGIERMVEEDAYCTDILMQVSAANAALNIKAGKEDTVDELVDTLGKLMR